MSNSHGADEGADKSPEPSPEQQGGDNPGPNGSGSTLPATRAAEASAGDAAAGGEDAHAAKAEEPKKGGKAGKPEKPPKPAGKGGGFFRFLFGLLMLGGLGALGFYYWEQQKAIDVLFSEYNAINSQRNAVEQRLADIDTERERTVQGLQQEIDERFDAVLADNTSRFDGFRGEFDSVREEISGYQGQLETSQARIAEAEAALEQQRQQITRLNQELVDARMRLTQMGGSSSQAWRLDEAESLLRLARERLLNARDINTVIGLYQSTDELLRQINDPAVTAVRDVLANELDMLRGVQVPDIQALYAALVEAGEGLDDLAIAAELDGGELRFSPPPAAGANGENGDDEEPGWLDGLSETLGQYFIVRRSESPLVSQLSPEQVFMIRQVIRLDLEQAKVALLRGNIRVYQLTLDSAASGIDEYLTGDDKQALLQTLQRLRNTAIVANIPPVGSTLNALRQINPETLQSGTANGQSGEAQP